MLISWMATGSVGMIIARYLKGVAKGQGCFGKDFWFVVSHFTAITHKGKSDPFIDILKTLVGKVISCTIISNCKWYERE